MGRSTSAVVGFLATLVASSVLGLNCGLVLDDDAVQCVSDEDCIGFGEGYTCDGIFCVPPVEDPEWACLGNIDTPSTIRPGVSHRFQHRVVELSTNLPPRDGTHLRLCRTIDQCAEPLFDNVPYDADGIVVVEVPDGFQGYFEVSHDDPTTYVPYISMIGPVFEDTIAAVPMQLFSPPTEQTVLALIGGSLLEGRTALLPNLGNCLDEAQAGLTVDIEPKTGDETVWYFEGIIPAPAATSTDAGGIALILNVSPGTKTLITRRASDGAFVGQHTFLALEGFRTGGFLAPTAAPADGSTQ